MNQPPKSTCIDCEHCFPDSDGPTSMGICLLNSEFEPYLEEIMELDFERCHGLIRKKRFDFNREACPDFSPAETMEIEEFDELLGGDESTDQNEKEKNFDLRQIDFKTLPVEPYLQDLYSSSRSRRENALNSIGSLTSLGNEKARDVLLNFLKDLGPPQTLEQAKFKVEILRHFRGRESNRDLLDMLLSDLENTASNNSPRQWITAILDFLGRAPVEPIKGQLQSMVDRKVFFQRLIATGSDRVNPLIQHRKCLYFDCFLALERPFCPQKGRSKAGSSEN